MISTFTQFKLTTMILSVVFTMGCTNIDQSENDDHAQTDLEHQQEHSANRSQQARDLESNEEQSPRNKRDGLIQSPSDWLAERSALRESLVNMARESKADSVDYCVAKAFGQSPCGGPESYLVFSTQDMNHLRLKEIEKELARYNEIDRLIKTQRDVVGSCQHIEPPQVALDNKRCIGKPAFLID